MGSLFFALEKGLNHQTGHKVHIDIVQAVVPALQCHFCAIGKSERGAIGIDGDIDIRSRSCEALVDLDSVLVPTKILDHIAAIGVVKVEQVTTRTAPEEVVTGRGRQNIVTTTANQPVITGTGQMSSSPYSPQSLSQPSPPSSLSLPQPPTKVSLPS